MTLGEYYMKNWKKKVGILKNNPFVEENFQLDNMSSGCTRIVLPMLYNGVIRIVLGCILSL
jgi:hypothetical protein